MADFKKAFQSLMMQDTLQRMSGKSADKRDPVAVQLGLTKTTLTKDQSCLGDLTARQLAYVLVDIIDGMTIDVINAQGGDNETAMDKLTKMIKKKGAKKDLIKQVVKASNIAETEWHSNLLAIVKAGLFLLIME